MVRLGEDKGLPQEERSLRLGEGGVGLGKPDDRNVEFLVRLGYPVTVLRLVLMAYLGSVSWPGL